MLYVTNISCLFSYTNCYLYYYYYYYYYYLPSFCGAVIYLFIYLPTIRLNSMLSEIVMGWLSFLLLIILKEFSPAVDYTLSEDNASMFIFENIFY